MAYVGNQPARGQWRKLTDISASFNGVLTTFTTSVPPGTSAYYVTAGSASQLIVSLGGVIQQPDLDYTVSTNSITFTTAPASGLSFFAVLGGDALNTGTPSDGSVTTAKLAGGLSVGLGAGSVTTPSLFFTGDVNTGVYSPAADTIAFAEGGTEAMRIDSSGRLLVGTSSARNVAYGGASLIQTEITNSFAFSAVQNSNNANGCAISLGKSRGTAVGGTTVLNSGDDIGIIAFAGADGTDVETQAASISCAVDGAPGANDMPGRLVFSTCGDGASSPTERARITNTGHFKATTDANYTSIDTNTHGARQTVSGNWVWMQVNSTVDPYGMRVSYTGAAPNGAGNIFIECADSVAVRFLIKSNGGINNYSANNTNLSDRNAKKDISPATDTWDCIKEWEIVNYRYKDQPDGADLNLGVIAQQVAESCPEVITVFEEAKDDQPEKLGVKEQQMYWMAIKALQEAQVRIEQLEAKVAALETA